MGTLALWVLPVLCGFSLAALPAKPQNISCILYHDRNFTCTWSPEKEASNTWYKVKRTRGFGEKGNNFCDSHDCPSENRARCSFLPPTITVPDNYTIQVEARNEAGTVESEVTRWRLNNIIKTEPPGNLSVKRVSGAKRMVQVIWTRPMLAPVSSTLNYMLRFRTENSTHLMEVNFTKHVFDEDQTTYNLTGLQPFTEYVIALQCADQNSELWSGWSQEARGATAEEAPLGLALWRVLRPAQEDGRRPVRLLWKKARGAPVLEKTLGYRVWYFQENSTNLTETVNTTSYDLYLGSRACWVSVASYNSLGQSPVATLRIPAVSEKPFRRITVVNTHHTQDQLVVTWESSSWDVDTWTVEWLPDDPELSTLSWESVSRARNWTIQQDKLAPFQCYNISVYPMLQDRVGEPYSVQAYSTEDKPTAGPVVEVVNIGVNTATVVWKEIPKSERNGFISNYTIFYEAENGKEFSETVSSSVLWYDLESLTRGTSYAVRVMASNRMGGANSTGANFNTSSVSVLEICLISFLVGGGLIVLIALTVAYGPQKRNNLKHLCWPDVPNPAESSLATWHGDDLKEKLYLKEYDNPVNTEDGVLKPCPAPRDLIDKLVVNFENFLEDVSTEESGKGQDNNLGGEKNEYVASPYRPYCPPTKSFTEPPASTEIPARKSQPLGSGRPEAREQLVSPAQSVGPAGLRVEEAPNPYLKNSVTTREFLVSEKLPGQAKREI
ncbi:interleukin-31 receptor subunit alpha isoform X2 [Saccopteryx bilineata]|uniref:interleukin-31 receptor subunit alpha isoform X2 n=1 Tax=Saccopteryx bilineata TaxID=59482 RepID=UPI00338F1302